MMVCCAQRVKARSLARLLLPRRAGPLCFEDLRAHVSLVHGLVWFKPRRMGEQWLSACMAAPAIATQNAHSNVHSNARSNVHSNARSNARSDAHSNSRSNSRSNACSNACDNAALMIHSRLHVHQCIFCLGRHVPCNSMES
mmetsp:Transcript_3735/g.10147  ORF Transcript_3735/g.10147 Transcript_3735/m.10147 type:complete len:141 (-) Transcript_3735:484-906(-)